MGVLEIWPCASSYFSMHEGEDEDESKEDEDLDEEDGWRPHGLKET